MLAGDVGGVTSLMALLDQAKSQWVAKSDAIVSLDGTDDHENDRSDGNAEREKKRQDQPEGQDTGEYGDTHRDLEVQNFFALLFDKRHGLLLDEPEDERSHDVQHRDSWYQTAQKGKKVADHRHHAFVFARPCHTVVR